MDAPEIPTLKFFERLILCYGLDRVTYLRELASAEVTARRAG